MGFRRRKNLQHSLAFAVGTLCILMGVAFRICLISLAAKDMHFQLNGIPMTNLMRWGMVLIVAGIMATAYRLFPTNKIKGSRRER